MENYTIKICWIRRISILLLCFVTGSINFSVFGQDVNSVIDSYNVSWNTPGPTSAESMPIGNGDIGLNVWVESNGEINFYISKVDAWSETTGDNGLIKLGRVRVSLNPAPAVTPFVQVLKLRTGEIEITVSNTTFRIWVDANNPVIRLERTSTQPASMTVDLIDWRTAKLDGVSPDLILSNEPNKIAWYHRNLSTADPHLANVTFGAIIKGNGLITSNSTSLVSAVAATSQLVSIYPLTTRTATATEWLTQLNQKVAQIEALSLEATRTAHQAWWDKFWHRSWVFVRGDAVATTTTQGYLLQRFITACSAQGAYPFKFNGSIFNVDDPATAKNADYRSWGAKYWFQNTRAMYWPRLEAGDFDMMMPLFDMYYNILPANTAQVLGYYGHAGAYFAETAPFWGGLPYAGPEVTEDWTLHYFTPILELSMMMLDYYEYTGDLNFASQKMLPVAKAGITFFDKHFARVSGKLNLNPVNAIEMYWKVNNPAPDIAGLRAVLTRLIALPNTVVDASTKAYWNTFLQEIPELPTETVNGKKLLLPYTGPQTAAPRNGENPELYSIYPFRIYGMNKPDLLLAQETFNARKKTFKGCWSQDPIQAAMLGFSDIAKSYVSFNLSRKDPAQKFPAFWAKANDAAPDQDNGGNGENGLQQMIMQVDGKRIILTPAWPVGWDCDFKLNAPFQTTVQGTISNGIIRNLVVTPSLRAADVIIIPPATSKVMLYSNTNYTGTPSQGLSVGRYTAVQLTAKEVTDNTTSSIKIPRGWNVMLYDNDNFTGASLTLTADNANLSESAFNDMLTSLVITAPVILYPNTSFNGTPSKEFTVGTYTTAELVAKGCPNNAASSIKVPHGIRVELYDGDNFTGTMITLTVDDAVLGDFDMNDKVSSMKIVAIEDTSTETSTSIEIENKNSISPNKGIILYPNPVSTVLNFKNLEDGSLVTIRNELGQVVLTGKSSSAGINVSKLIPGIYLLNAGKNKTIKFIKI